ncbi:unnamed protein product, partial [Brassicogethes aeneus]
FLIDGQTEIVLRLKEGGETPVGTLIYKLRGADPDGDRLLFGVRNSQVSDIIRVESTSRTEASVFLNKELDREERDEYALVLTLTDGHLGQGNYVTQSLLLLVEDVNDNIPIFKNHQPSVMVREDESTGPIATLEATDADEGAYGQVVYHLGETDDAPLFSVSTVGEKAVVRLIVHAVDGDRGVNNPIEYSISSNSITNAEASLFSINADTGLVVTSNLVDRESGSESFILQITATELQSSITPHPSTTTEVTVMIMDENDESPRFKSTRYECEISENSPVNTPVTFLGNAIPEVFDFDQVRFFLYGRGLVNIVFNTGYYLQITSMNLLLLSYALIFCVVAFAIHVFSLS